MLLGGNDSDTDVTISINRNYAGRYNRWRQKEELQKLKDRYHDQAERSVKDSFSSDDSSSSDDEDDNADQLTEQFEQEFFKTLSCLKKKDPRIYDKNVSFFNVTTEPQPQKQVNKVKNEEKPLFLRDYERKLIVEKEGKISDEEKEDNEHVRPASPTIAEEEKLIKESLKGALKDGDEDQDDEKAWGGLFQKRQKTTEEEEKEEAEYREWLKGQKEDVSDKDIKNELKGLHDYWNDPNLEEGEKFLKDYILNKRFLQDEDNEDYIPTYEEIVHDSDENLSEDEKTIERQREFEHKFNFRFEEPDQEFIKRYPRTMENSLRKKDERRKQKRQEIRERKAAEEAKKREELKRLKALKRKEIMDKIEKLKHITGNDEVGFKDEDLEGDFDPEGHDRRMRQLFNSEYFNEEEESKPEFPEIDEELEIEQWDSWSRENNWNYYENGNEEDELHCEDPDFNMDCDYDPSNQLQNEMIEATKRKKKGRKWKSKFAEAVAREKPVFDSTNHTFDEYLDEYYKLDFEDLIGDLPCRFKYRKVVPNSFGLSIDEILQAEDRELNQWCSLKRAVQHRPDHVEKYDVVAYRKKAGNELLKKKVFQSIYNEGTTNEQEAEDENTAKRKKKRSKKLKSNSPGNDIEPHTSNILFQKKVNQKLVEETHSSNSVSMDGDSTASDGSHKNVIIYNNDNFQSVIVEPNEKPKKNKRKHNVDEYDDETPVDDRQKKKKRECDTFKGIDDLHNREVEKNSAVESGNNDSVMKQHKKRKHNNFDSIFENSDSLKNTAGNNSLLPQTSDQPKKKKKKKKKKHTPENAPYSISIEVVTNLSNVSKFKKHKEKGVFAKKQKQKSFGKMSQKEDCGLSISDARLRAFGINPKKYKNKLKYGRK